MNNYATSSFTVRAEGTTGFYEGANVACTRGGAFLIDSHPVRIAAEASPAVSAYRIGPATLPGSRAKTSTAIQRLQVAAASIRRAA